MIWIISPLRELQSEQVSLSDRLSLLLSAYETRGRTIQTNGSPRSRNK